MQSAKLPADPIAALDVRFLDRFFDLHVMNAAQHAVDGALTGDPVKRRDGLALSKEKLERGYAWLEGQLSGRTWAAARSSRWRTAQSAEDLDAPDFRSLSRSPRLPHTVACPTVRPGR